MGPEGREDGSNWEGKLWGFVGVRGNDVEQPCLHLSMVPVRSNATARSLIFTVVLIDCSTVKKTIRQHARQGY